MEILKKLRMITWSAPNAWDIHKVFYVCTSQIYLYIHVYCSNCHINQHNETCPATDDQIREMWHIHTKEFYSNIEMRLWGYQDSSVCKSAYRWTWQPEFNSWDLHSGQGELISSFLLAVVHLCLHTCAHSMFKNILNWNMASMR